MKHTKHYFLGIHTLFCRHMCLLYYNLCLSKDGAALSGWRPRPRDVSIREISSLGK